MAPATDSTQPNNGSISCFQKTVCLYDWWLVKADKDFKEKRLAVAGLTSRQGEAVRPFISAPIVKRYDDFSLLTADGVYIILKGLINKLHSSENGFPPEVFNKFLFGFPRGWGCYAVNCYTVELTTGIDSGRALISNSSEIGPEFLSSVVENSTPASLRSDSKEKSSGNNEKSIPEESLNVSGMGWGNVASGNVSNRHSAGVQNIQICDQKKTASGSSSKHPYKEQNPASRSLKNSDREKLNSPRTPIQSRGDVDESYEETPVQPQKETNMPSKSKQLVGEFASSVSRPLPANTEGQNKRSSIRVLATKKGMTSSSAAGIKRKIVFGKEKSKSLQNSDRKKLNSPRTPNQSRGDVDESYEETPVRPQKESNMPSKSKHLVGEFASSVSRPSAANTKGQNKRSSIGGLATKKGMASSSAAGIKRKIVFGKEKSKSLQNPDRKKVNSPRTPKQSRGDVDESYEETPVWPQTNMPSKSKRLVGEFASSVSRPLPANTEGQNKRSAVQRSAAEKRMMSSAPAGLRKTVVGKDKSNDKIESLSASKIKKRSRSGRLLLPPLEFWRNQIPVYNLDHELVEIRQGPLLESLCRDCGSPSRKKHRQ